jgi:hypothetical protein
MGAEHITWEQSPGKAVKEEVTDMSTLGTIAVVVLVLLLLGVITIRRW